jgi:hypothetical protein
MGFIFDPNAKEAGQEFLADTMLRRKTALEHSLPFAMDPVVYDFEINDQGSTSEFFDPGNGFLPPGYYSLMVPGLLRKPSAELSSTQRMELQQFRNFSKDLPQFDGMVSQVFNQMFPTEDSSNQNEKPGGISDLLVKHGFDPAQHESIRTELKAGRIGLAQNRLPVSTDLRDIDTATLISVADSKEDDRDCGLESIRSGQVAVLTLAAGAGSRWTQGAGVVKAINPFCRFEGKHRSFIETHLAKSRKVSRHLDVDIPHLFTTSYLTHQAIQEHLDDKHYYDYFSSVYLSPGKTIGLRMIPTVRDLRFHWEETAQQQLDEQAQKVRDSFHAAMLNWAVQSGEASDYLDNLPNQCLHPVGHWYEVPNLLKNGILLELLKKHPSLKYLMMHNIDTLGADLDPTILGCHIRNGSVLSFEVIHRRMEDRGGGLALIDGRPRLVEGLALPREEDEFRLSYYNSMTTWMDIDQVLEVFGLKRQDLEDRRKIELGIRRIAKRLPTYITIKDVKKRWGHGQEDIFPVTQFEKLWSDMTLLPDLACRFIPVSRMRGQQLKEPHQLDGWFRDGSAQFVASRTDWG